MSGILEKRRCLHKRITSSEEQNKLLEARLAQLQALTNIGTVSCMIAHEMNNILTPLANYAQLALNNPDDQALAHKALEKTAVNSARASKVLDSMLALVNGENQVKKDCRLKLIIDDIFTCMCRDFSKDKIHVEIDVPDELSVYAVAIQIQQVLMNLILNARDSMLAKGGQLTIRAGCDDDSVTIEVTDTGCGIAAENLDKIFEPFFTTKAKIAIFSHSGTGLGLAFCRQVVQNHNGRITVASDLGAGTSFKIVLPGKEI